MNTRCLLVCPSGVGHGAISVGSGIQRFYDRQGVSAKLFQPINYGKQLVKNPRCEQVSVPHMTKLISNDELDVCLEKIVANYNRAIAEHKPDIAIVVGLKTRTDTSYADRFNAGLARALGAKVILVGNHSGRDLDDLQYRVHMASKLYGGAASGRILGGIMNRWGIPRDEDGNPRHDLLHIEPEPVPTREELLAGAPILSKDVPLLGLIPWDKSLIAGRVSDVQSLLGASYIHEGAANRRRVNDIIVAARNAGNIDVLRYGTLVVTPGDRDDVVLAAAMAEMSDTPTAGLLLTGGYRPTASTMRLIEPALERGLPVLSTDLQTYDATTRIPNLSPNTPLDDIERQNAVADFMADQLDHDRLMSVVTGDIDRRLSPAAFRHGLVEKASANIQRIVLPEGDEPRTIQAAIACAERGIAKPILIGNRERIESIAQSYNLSIGDGIEVLEPEEHREDYVEQFVELRKHKGMNEVRARQLLEDNVVLGTMMLQQGHVDGLVSGAVHTTASTILPALQLIKTKPTASLVSSCFFMCLPDQVAVYADCAVNPDPTAAELADIAIQSADSARSFGIPPKVAMISYSTGTSGSGADVDKVREATRLAQEKRPDLEIDGPLQFDAATTPTVAASKAPNSPVAGQATVLVFPDLNTGNTTYKAVQRSAKVISIGPMLQGMNKPVNDLSRGALVEDIIFTIALTAIQAVED